MNESEQETQTATLLISEEATVGNPSAIVTAGLTWRAGKTKQKGPRKASEIAIEGAAKGERIALAEGWLYTEGIYTVFGPSKSLKSTTVFSWANELSQGHDLHEDMPNHAGRPMTTCYVNTELDDQLWLSRYGKVHSESMHMLNGEWIRQYDIDDRFARLQAIIDVTKDEFELVVVDVLSNVVVELYDPKVGMRVVDMLKKDIEHHQKAKKHRTWIVVIHPTKEGDSYYIANPDVALAAGHAMGSATLCKMGDGFIGLQACPNSSQVAVHSYNFRHGRTWRDEDTGEHQVWLQNAHIGLDEQRRPNGNWRTTFANTAARAEIFPKKGMVEGQQRESLEQLATKYNGTVLLAKQKLEKELGRTVGYKAVHEYMLRNELKFGIAPGRKVVERIYQANNFKAS